MTSGYLREVNGLLIPIVHEMILLSKWIDQNSLSNWSLPFHILVAFLFQSDGVTSANAGDLHEKYLH